MKHVSDNIKRLAHSKIMSNTLNQFMLYGFSNFIPLFLMPFLLATIGVDCYGLIYFILGFTFYFQIINEFGFDLSNVRHIAENRNNSIQLSYVFSAILQCRLLLFVITSIPYIIIILNFEKFNEFVILYSIALVRLLGITLTPYWFFRSMEDMKNVTKISLFVKILSTLPIFIFVRTPKDTIWVIFFFSLECVLSSCISIWLAIKKYNMKLTCISWKTMLFFLKDSIPFFSSTLFKRIYQNSNIVLLGFFSTPTITGIYTVSEKLYNAYASFMSPLIVHVLYPYFTRVRDFVRINKIVISLCIGNIIILYIIYMLGGFIIPMITDSSNLNEILFYFNLFLILLAISIPNDILGFPYLGVMGFIKEVNYSTIYASVFYLCIIGVLFLANSINIVMLITTLILTNILSLVFRLYYIRQNRNLFYK